MQPQAVQMQPYQPTVQVAMMPAGPGQQVMGSAKLDPNRARPVFAGGNPDGSSKLLYHAYAHPKARTMHTCRGLCYAWTAGCIGNVNTALSKNRFVQVWDNKVVINEPVSWMWGCYNGSVSDNITVLYLDRPVTAVAEKAVCCKPFNAHDQHCMMFPDCCGMWGETLIIHAPPPQNCCSCVPQPNCCSQPCCQSFSYGTTKAWSSSCAPIDGEHINDGRFVDRKIVFGMENVENIAAALKAAHQMRGSNHPVYAIWYPADVHTPQ